MISTRVAATTLLAAIAASFPSAIFALPLSDVNVGDAYYIHNTLTANDLVTVLSVDRSTGRVKVRYQTGAVDYVDPASLQTERRSDAADVAAGTVLFGGIAWALLDSDGFKGLCNSRANTGPLPATRLLTTADIVAVPFAPVVPGLWHQVADARAWTDWATARVAQFTGETRVIAQVRTKAVPFYGKPEALLVECIEPGKTGAYYFLTMTGTTQADLRTGSGAGIYDFNKAADLTLDSPPSGTRLRAVLRFGDILGSRHISYLGSRRGVGAQAHVGPNRSATRHPGTPWRGMAYYRGRAVYKHDIAGAP